MIPLVKQDSRFVIKSSFNKVLNGLTREIQGYRYDMDKKEWSLPISTIDEFCKKLNDNFFEYTIDEDPTIEYYEQAPDFCLKLKRCIESKKYVQLTKTAPHTYHKDTRTLTFQLADKRKVLEKLKELNISFVNAAEIKAHETTPTRAWAVRDHYAVIVKKGKNKYI